MDGVRAKADGADAFAATDGDRGDERDERDPLAAARPDADVIEMARVAARLEQKLFGRSPALRLGKYVVGEQLGKGGMGAVYRGHDAGLGRDVALKLLHPGYLGDERARARMRQEAKTLAAIDHPSVVSVHELVEVGEQLVLVMPLVAGVTLAEWAHQAKRSWREIVRAYAKAGEGLARAHAVGVVHRDFKPSNAMIRADGEVRVLDFGLARGTGAEVEPAVTPEARPAAVTPEARPAAVTPEARPATVTPEARPAAVGPAAPARVTETGALLGTPGYWSPEQLAGEPATAASDQYSFCVALHVALEGQLPFDVDVDLVSRERELAAKQRGVIRHATDGRAIPAWLRALIARGLSPAPADRFPSMKALVAELERPRGWRRWRTATLLGASTVVAAAATFVAIPSAAPPPCDGGLADIAPVWNLARRIQLDATLATIPGPALAASHDKILSSLDDYRDRWQSIHRAGCVARRKGSESDRMTDRRAACLQQRLADLRATISVLERTDRSTAVNAQATVGKLPALDACADPSYLSTDGPPPPPPTQAAAVADIRRRLADARAADNAGRSDEARAIAAEAAASADQSAYAPVIAEASLLHGRILLARADATAAVTALTHARAAAFATGLDVIAVEAEARKLFAEAQLEERTGDLLREAEPFVELSRGLAGDHFARPLLLNNIAAIHQSNGDREAAMRQLEVAHAELVARPSGDIELTAIEINLGTLTRDPVRRVALLRGAWERRRAALDDHHLSTLEALEMLARYESDEGAAFAYLTELSEALAAHHPELVERRARVASYRAFLAEQLGDPGAALSSYRDVVALVPADSPRDTIYWRDLAIGHAARLTGDPQRALAALEPVAAAFRESPHWWMRQRAGDAELGIGLTELARSREDTARPHLLRAAQIYDEARAHSEKQEFALRAALAHRSLE